MARKLVEQAYAEVLQNSLANMCNYLVLFGITLALTPLWHDYPALTIFLSSLMLLSTAFRLAWASSLHRKKSGDVLQRKRLISLGVYLGAGIWAGYCSILCCFYGPTLISLLTVALTALISVGAVRTLGPSLRLAAHHAMVLLVPIIVWAFFHRSFHSVLAAGFIALYAVLVLMEIARYNRFYWENVTNRALLQERASELAQAKEFAENIFNGAGVGLCVTDNDGHVIKTNAALEKMLGYGPGELIGMQGIDFSVADASEAAFARMKKNAFSDGFFDDYESLWRRKDGSAMPCALSNTMLKDAEGNAAGLVTSVRDITKRRKAEGELREQEEMLRSFVMQSFDGISLYDSEAKVTLWNQGMEMITGLTEKEVSGRHYWDIAFQLVPEEKRSGELYEVLKGAYDMYVESDEDYRIMHEFPLLRADGMLREVQSFPFLIRTPGRAFFALICRDITERKTAEEEREKLVEELREALERVKTLRGLLPICASCKKIRDNNGYWNNLESYIQRHSEAEFSHGLCPECAKKLYPDLYVEKE